MQVFKTFLKVLKKNMGVSMIYIIIFMVIAYMMSTASSDKKEYEASKLDVGIIDMDNSDESKALSDYISDNHNLVEIENDKDEMLDSLYYRTVDVIITINEGYSEKLAGGETDGLITSRSIEGTYSESYFENQLNRYLGVVSAYVKGGSTIEDAVTKASELMEKEISVNVVSFNEESETEFSNSMASYFQYLAYILISIMITSLCPTLLTMTHKEIGNRTNCSCMTVTSRMMQLTAGTAVYTLLVFGIIFAGAAFMFGKELFTTYGLLALLNSFVYLIVSMAITLLISVFAPGKNAVSMIANVLGLGMSFLCGVFVPQYLLSDAVIGFGRFLPAYWFVKANNMLAGFSYEVYSVSKFMTCIGIQLAFAIAVLCVTLLVSKTKQTSKSIG